MSNLHRLAWADAEIRAGRHPNATTLARRFEISRRQAARDFEYLRYTMGAPLEYCHDRRGYTYSDQAYALPAVVMTEAEVSALSYLAEAYSGMDGDGADRIAAVLRRLAGRSVRDDGGTEGLPIAGINARELHVMDVLRYAIERRRKVSVRYRGADGVVTSRTIAPYALVTRPNGLACIAHCDDVCVTTALPLARVEAAERLSEAFVVPPVFDADSWGGDGSGLRHEPFVAVVQLENPSAADRLESATRLAGDTYKLDFYDSDAILSALLGCRDGFTILQPKWLRAKLIRRLRPIVEAHDTADGRRVSPVGGH